MSLAEICVRRPVFASMLILFLVVLGAFSFLRLGVDLFPKADIPIINVTLNLKGASPEELVGQVVLPVEDQVSSVSGLDDMDTMVNEGQAKITLRFTLDRNIEDAAQDVREKVSLAMKQLPQDIEPPIITKADPDSDPILTVTVGGPRAPQEITEIADKRIKRALQTVAGVASVDLGGGRHREIHIVLDAEKMSANHITVGQVSKVLRTENIEIPGGKILQGSSELGVRTMGRVEGVRQFEKLTLTHLQDRPIRISDVGSVLDTFEEPRSFSMLDGKPAVSLEIRRQAGTNTIKVVDEVRRKLREIQLTLPRDLEIQLVNDQSLFIRASVNALEEHLWLGGLLASLVILLFIRNWRAVVIASVAIPTSIIATFTIMRLMDFSLNNMTLLALTLAVGIVIDDAIVVLENIFRHMEELHKPPIQAAIDGTKEISLAVLATTISLVIIFVPIAFITGYAQRYLNSFGWTMAFSVMVSMLVAFTLTPALSARFLAGAKTFQSKETPFFTFIEHHYQKMLGWSLRNPWVVVGLSALVMLSLVPLNRLVGRDFIPADDQGEFTIHTDTPEGMSYEGSYAFGRDIEVKLRKLEGVEHVRTVTGGRLTHIHFYVELVDLEKRKVSSAQVAAEARKIIAQYPTLQQKISFPNALGGGESFGFPIQVQILGPDLDTMASYAEKAAREILSRPGIPTAYPGINKSAPELRVNVNRDQATDLGVSSLDIADTVRLLMSGEEEISTYRELGEQYPVKTVLLPGQRQDREIMGRLMVPSAKLGQVRLDSVAEMKRGLSPASINRYNRQFNVPIYIVNSASKPLSVAIDDVNDVMNALKLPPGYSYRFVGTVKALDETTRSLIMAFLLAAVFMYMVLAAQFESLSQPFIIMLALPLSLPFALLSLYVTGQTLNFWSAVGILLLLGIVKKNAILQVDATNRLMAEGYELRDAIMTADRTRLRPILMTTFCILAGLLPTAFGRGAGSGQRSAIAVTIIGGQLLCLLLTLLLTPVAYELVTRLGAKRIALPVPEPVSPALPVAKTDAKQP